MKNNKLFNIWFDTLLSSVMHAACECVMCLDYLQISDTGLALAGQSTQAGVGALHLEDHGKIRK